MDLNQYLDRMSIKTTIIRIHDVSKAYIRLLTSRASILGPGIKVPPLFGFRTRLILMGRAHEGQKKNSASQQAGGLIKWADILPYFTMFYIVK